MAVVVLTFHLPAVIYAEVSVTGVNKAFFLHSYKLAREDVVANLVFKDIPGLPAHHGGGRLEIGGPGGHVELDAFFIGSAPYGEFHRIDIVAGGGSLTFHKAAAGVPGQSLRQVVDTLDAILYGHNRMILLRGALRHADFVHEGLPRNGKNGVGACQTALQAGHPSGVLLLGIGILLHRPLVFEARQGERYRVIGIGLERIGFHRLGEGDDVQVGLDLNADFRPRNARDGSHVHVAVEGGGGQFRRIRPFHCHGGGIGGRREGDGTGGKVTSEAAAELLAGDGERHAQQPFTRHVGATGVDVELQEGEDVLESES